MPADRTSPREMTRLIAQYQVHTRIIKKILQIKSQKDSAIANPPQLRIFTLSKRMKISEAQGEFLWANIAAESL